MPTTNLIRWSGLVSILAGILYTAGALLHPVGEDMSAVSSSNWVPAHLVYWVSALLMHFALLGLYVRQREQSGWLGLAGFVLGFIGTALVSSILLYVATVLPLIADEAPVIFEQAVTSPAYVQLVFILGFGLGWILLGIVTMRAGVLPRWAGLLLIVGVSLFVIAEAASFGTTMAHTLVTTGDIIFGLGLAWIGYALWLKESPGVKQPRSAPKASAL